MSLISKPLIDANYIKFISQNAFVDCTMFTNVQLNMNGEIKINGKVKEYKIKNPKSYIRVSINNKKYSLNRLMAVTFYDMNYYDDYIVDHLNHDRKNNDIDNLRISTNSINSSNTINANLAKPNPTNLISLNEFHQDLYFDKSTNQIMIKLYDDLFKIPKIKIRINPKSKTEYKSIKFSQNNKEHHFSYKRIMDYIHSHHAILV